ncbi:MFS transporter [Myxacorys almedinensis]|uniref:MFS transporter n=1 Tax=Myxacorys almedinensis A TaxID=2690445 RepID=A0A8J7Z0M2_9CYAN|nr:MFS transporter [Myxacorys almedinensis]NDJ17529.1 MFS transporter [Myxacorys almedinensis A]
MIQLANMSWEWSQMAQIPINRGVARPEDAALVFSGPQFFVALIAGVVLAFAFQLVLTNLSVATGISVLGRMDSNDSEHHHSSSSGSAGGTIRKVGLAVGIWTLVTVTIAIFLACLLAVRLSLINSIGLGAIVGLVIWATYFSLLVWVSSSTVGSLIGSLVNSATSGFQALVGTVGAAMGAKAVNQQVVSTAEAAAAAVRRELGSAIDPGSIRESLEDYLDRVRPAQLDMSRIRRELEGLVNDPELQNIVGAGSPADVVDRLRHIDRNTFVNLVSSRTDLSRQESQRLIDQLEAVWNDTLGRLQRKDPTQGLTEYLQTVQSGQVDTNELNRRIDQLAEEVRRQGQMMQGTQQNQSTAMRDQMSAISSMAQRPQKEQQGSLLDRAVQMGMSTLMGSVVGRADLSDLDVEKILGQLQGAKDKLTSGAKEVTSRASSGFSPIRSDVENYLLNTYSWHLNRETLNTEFREALYDPEADPAAVRRELERLNRSDFVRLLTQRGDLSAARVSDIADQLESIRTSVLGSVSVADEQERSQDLRSRVENYLRSTGKDQLNPDDIEREVSLLLEDPDAGYEALSSRLRSFDRDTLVQFLSQRQDLSQDEADQIISRFEHSRDRILNSAKETQDRVRSEAEALRIRVESYLRNTHKGELDPDGIKRDFRTLLDDPQAGASALRGRLSQFDHDTFVQLLSQRQDMTPEEADRIVSQLEDVRDSILHAPQRAVSKAKDQVDQVTSAIADYLRNTHRDELDPDGIQRDLNVLLNDPKAGMYRFRSRLSQMDRETLVQLLAQRQDLSEEQVNRIIDDVQHSIRRLVRSPRRLAARTQRRVENFQSALDSYLRNTDKEELNPDGIQRDLQLLLRDPRAGFGNLSDRLSHVDRSTLIALLAQREDMTEDEAARVVDQVLSVRDQFMAQVHAIQDRLQSIVDGIFERIRLYLNGLERPELNYEGISNDVRTMFHDPQAGFDAMRDRLGSFNRDTLVAVMSSRDDVSEAQANRIIDQVENARNNVLRRAERMQEDAQRRLEEVKRQAMKQAEETRKAAASAAWWLFGTAIVSAGAAALAGALAVG